MNSQNYYDVLGICKDVSQKEIQKAFRRLARELHPDVNPGQQGAAKRYNEINEAYQTLYDPERRQNYDKGKVGLGIQGNNIRVRRNHWSNDYASESVPEDLLLDMNPFDDVMGDILNWSKKGFINRTVCAFKTRTITHKVDLTLEEVYQGVTRFIDLYEKVVCSECSSQIGDCVYCSGKGFHERKHHIPIDFPPGVPSPFLLELSTEKFQVPFDAGEIYIEINVLPHDMFQRRGDDIYCQIFVPIYEAILGGEVQVSLLKGTVALTIPPGTQNGQTFIIEGTGLPIYDSNNSGDTIVEVLIQIPEVMSYEELALVRKLRELRDQETVT